MQTITLKTHVGSDGIPRLELPVGETDVDCQITVMAPAKLTHEEWLAFIDKTAGSLADDPIERGPQGEQSPRDEIE